MIELLKTELPHHYGLHRTAIAVPAENTMEQKFDLVDNIEGSMVVAFRSGNVSLDMSEPAETEIINYEQYLNGLAGTKFEQGRKRCDYIVYEKSGEIHRFFVLNEQTSAIGSTQLLSKPILDKNKNVQYPEGKYEQVEVQFRETLRTLVEVPSIAAFIGKSDRKVCLMSYVITPRADISNAQKAFVARYKQIEARETGEDGALLLSPEINTLGFEYRRISHDYVFHLF